MRRILAKLAALFRRKRAEAELSREVAAHLTLLEDEFRGQGMSEEEARLAARRSYGNVELTKELYRDEWRFAWFEALGQDLRAAWRSLRKSPGFAATAVVSLAFGIGANTAIFTMVNGVLLKKLPVADPERIVQIKATLSRWLESLLYEVTPWDPIHVAATLGILLLGGMVAAYLPALRATRIDPLQALKCD